MANKKKAPKLNLRKVFLIIILITLISGIGYYIFNLPTKNIIIKGTTLIKDNEIITRARLEGYPRLYHLNLRKITNIIKQNDLVSEVEIKRNLKGQLIILIKENKVLFFNQNTQKIVLSNQKEVDDNNIYLGIPTLINYVPDEIYQALVNGFAKVTSDVINQISEIEYAPSQNEEGKFLDDKRFLLTMNDGNVVIVNIINILRLNKYLDIYASLDNKKGTIQLDSSNSEVVSFIPFPNISNNQEEKDED